MDKKILENALLNAVNLYENNLIPDDILKKFD